MASACMLLSGAAALTPSISGRPVLRSTPLNAKLVDPDETPEFASDELRRAWERTGKGKRRWRPGDASSDYKMDRSLLWTSWKLTPPVLSVHDSDRKCACTRLVLGWVGFPHETVICESGETVSGHPLPVLAGAGLPTHDGIDGLVHAMEICR